MATATHAPTVVIDDLYPCLEGGRYPIKRVVDEPLEVYADIFKDGHDVITAVLKWRKAGAKRWFEAAMSSLENDRWKGRCSFAAPGRWEYVVEAWADTSKTWKKAFLARWTGDDPDLPIEASEGARLLVEAAKKARAAGVQEVAAQLEDCAEMLGKVPPAEVMELLQSDELQALMDPHANRSLSTESKTLSVIVERERARFSAWYAVFPRNAEGRTDKHSTFRDCVARLDDVKAMGFDTIYFPPIHPIGETNRQGQEQHADHGAGGCGIALGHRCQTGGHKDVEPTLGTIDDFVWLVQQAKERGLEIALDFAINCSPDHPYVKDHPDWFYQRPDGSIRYAENPPKKYQDIADRLSLRRLEEPVARADQRGAVLGRQGCEGVSREQPAHQARGLLGGIDRRCAGPRPGRDAVP